MEDALVLVERNDGTIVNHVLILVLMDDALVRSWKQQKNSLENVLILVLMEDALVLQPLQGMVDSLDGLNPCFNGWCTRTIVCKF